MTTLQLSPERLLSRRFVWLMDLYEENFNRLEKLFSPSTLVPDRYRSSVHDGFDVLLEIVERHAYTTEVRLSYDLLDPATGLHTPSAMLRIYADARVAEATHCLPGRQLVDVLGPFPAARTVVEHRLRMNTFLSRWLDYLSGHGHGTHTLMIDGAAAGADLAAGEEAGAVPGGLKMDENAAPGSS
jgi:uncharacterized protein YqiB (DUF1249 family)